MLLHVAFCISLLLFVKASFDSNTSEFMSFEDWKRLKLKTEPNFKNFSQIQLVKSNENRFNYASIDCAAKIISTNDGAKDIKSILKDDKDTYLINKCSLQDQFIVIELCQDILVDLVEVGNFEFFSSNFKRLKLSVNDRYEETNWKVLGEFVASNSRDLQQFTIANPMIWAKYLKIEILDHYGNEFYCPISLVKAYGKTMIEDFKEEVVKEDMEDKEMTNDECKVDTPLPYLGLSEFLSSIPEYCEVSEEEPNSNPQDSIYKSIIKRLSLLESNASLSLLYIEEQSKLLSNSFRNLQQQHVKELDTLIKHFNSTFDVHIAKLDNINQFKLFEATKALASVNNDLSFYKKLLLINFVLLVILLSFAIISNGIVVGPLSDFDKPYHHQLKFQFKVGSTKKKYKKY